MDPSRHGSRICGANIHECRHLFDTSALTAVLNNLYQNNAERYRLKSTERTLTEPRTPKLEMGIVAFMDKLKIFFKKILTASFQENNSFYQKFFTWHTLTTKEAGFFLQHMGITDPTVLQQYVGIITGGDRGDL